MIRFVAIFVMAIFLNEQAWAGEKGCLKKDVVQGGVDRSLPCIFLSPLPWDIHRVMFPANSSALDDRAKAVLDQQAEILRSYPDLAFTVWGHVDIDEANTVDGKALGFRRANAVRDYLVMHGIAPERITTDSRGDHAMIPMDKDEGTLAAMRYATTETEDNPRH